jgi:hypothetical protein
VILHLVLTMVSESAAGISTRLGYVWSSHPFYIGQLIRTCKRKHVGEEKKLRIIRYYIVIYEDREKEEHGKYLILILNLPTQGCYDFTISPPSTDSGTCSNPSYSPKQKEWLKIPTFYFFYCIR